MNRLSIGILLAFGALTSAQAWDQAFVLDAEDDRGVTSRVRLTVRAIEGHPRDYELTRVAVSDGVETRWRGRARQMGDDRYELTGVYRVAPEPETGQGLQQAVEAFNRLTGREQEPGADKATIHGTYTWHENGALVERLINQDPRGRWLQSEAAGGMAPRGRASELAGVIEPLVRSQALLEARRALYEAHGRRVETHAFAPGTLGKDAAVAAASSRFGVELTAAGTGAAAVSGFQGDLLALTLADGPPAAYATLADALQVQLPLDVWRGVHRYQGVRTQDGRQQVSVLVAEPTAGPCYLIVHVVDAPLPEGVRAALGE